MDAERFRADMHANGRTVRVWRSRLSAAVNPRTSQRAPGVDDGSNPDNLIYSELTLGAAVRVFIYSGNIGFTGEKVGLNSGSVMISCFRNEIPLARYYRVVPTSGQQPQSKANHTVARGTEGLLDVLRRPFVTSIIGVYDAAGHEYVEGTDYQLTPNATAYPFAPDNIEWLPDGTVPANGDTYGIEYEYRDVYTVLDQDRSVAQFDSNQNPLPEQWRLTLEQAGMN